MDLTSGFTYEAWRGELAQETAGSGDAERSAVTPPIELRLAEFVSALSLGVDLGFGQPGRRRSDR